MKKENLMGDLKTLRWLHKKYYEKPHAPSLCASEVKMMHELEEKFMSIDVTGFVLSLYDDKCVDLHNSIFMLDEMARLVIDIDNLSKSYGHVGMDLLANRRKEILIALEKVSMFKERVK